MIHRLRCSIYLGALATLMLLSSSDLVQAQTVVEGNVTGTWTATGSPYIVTGDVSVVDSLIIEPGVDVQIQAGGWQITVGSGAKLQAIGTKMDPIVFEPFFGSTPGLWQGIVLSGSGADDTLEHCRIDFAVRGIYVSSSQPLIDNCIIQGNSEAGIYLYQSVTGTLISHCQLFGNPKGLYFYVKDKHSSVIVDHCVVYGNEQGLSIYSLTTVYYLSSSATADVRHCTITQNNYGVFADGSNDWSDWYSSSADANVINTIVAFNTIAGFQNNHSYGKIGADNITYNCIWQNGDADFVNIGNSGILVPGGYANANGDDCDVNQNIYYDPFFVDTVSANYHLLGASRCVDAGNPVVGGQIVTDPNGTVPDIGAYWYDPSVPTLLSWFSAEQRSDFVEISWDTATPLPPDQFQLVAASRSGNRDIAFRLADDGQFVAKDPLTASMVGSEIIYQLSYRGESGEWQDLASEDVKIKVPSLRTGIEKVYPNPFNPLTTISYTVAVPGRVKLSVYNISGRLVKTLVDAHLGIGSRSEEWDGTDSAGRRVPSGAYFVRLKTEQGVATTKAVLTK